MILEELRLSAQFKFLKQCVYLISHPLMQSLPGPDAYPFCGLAMLPKQILFINVSELCTASQIVCHTLVTGELDTTPQRLMDVLDSPTYPAYQAAALNTVFVELQLVPPPNLGVAVVLNVVLLAVRIANRHCRKARRSATDKTMSGSECHGVGECECSL